MKYWRGLFFPTQKNERKTMRDSNNRACWKIFITFFFSLFFFVLFSNQICESKEVKSYIEIRYSNIDKQMAEFSCGIAVLATIFTHYFDNPVKEEEIAENFFKKMVEEKRGISLLDMKEFVVSKGFEAKGYKMNATGLLGFMKENPLPIIVHTQEDFGGGKISHFSILVGIVGGFFILNDTSLGNTIIPVEDFLHKWTGNIMVITPPSDKKEKWREVYEKIKKQVGEKAGYVSNIYLYSNFSSFYAPAFFRTGCYR